MSRIIKGDESSVKDYNQENKQLLSKKKSPSKRLKKVRQVRIAKKSMPVVFFYIKGVVHNEFIPQSRTVYADYHCHVSLVAFDGKNLVRKNNLNCGSLATGLSNMTTCTIFSPATT